jgi:hypothetical protein
MPESYGLGRIHAPDNRDCLYPLALVLDRLSTKRRERPWKRARVLDQGQTGTCVGHGWRGWFENEPTLHGASDGPDAFTIYRRAVLLDELLDNDSDATAPQDQLQSGSTVRAGAKAMQEAGLIGSYVWAYHAKEIADYVTRMDGSPVVLGTSWTESMFHPDPKTGIVRVAGQVVGGHCFVTDWYDEKTKRHRCYTSWGQGFGLKDENGIGGIFWLSSRNLDRLLKNGGEACMGVELVITPVKS